LTRTNVEFVFARLAPHVERVVKVKGIVSRHDLSHVSI